MAIPVYPETRSRSKAEGVWSSE